MKSEAYLNAARAIPPGETRTFLELAALAGRPGAARAAGRAVYAVAVRSDVPWHRVVAADGGLSREPARAREQLRRLRAEGARPRAREGVREWLERVGARLVGRLPDRLLLPAADARAHAWSAARVEPLRDEARALARGFRDPDRGDHPPPPRRRRRPSRRRTPLATRLGEIEPEGVGARLERDGLVHVPDLLSGGECEEIVRALDDDARLERTVEMGPRGLGVGTYGFLAPPLPGLAGSLLAELYARLRPAAEAWDGTSRPPTLAGYARRCHKAGQRRPACILLRYLAGGVNHPHRDQYGSEQFPFQALVVLSRAGLDFEGGEFVLYEDRPEGPWELSVVAASEGDLVLFAARERWEPCGARRRRVPLRHGMRVVTRGERLALGLVFNLAR